MTWNLLLLDGRQLAFADDQAVADHFAPDAVTYRNDSLLDSTILGRLYVGDNPHTAALALRPGYTNLDPDVIARLLRKLKPLPESLPD